MLDYKSSCGKPARHTYLRLTISTTAIYTTQTTMLTKKNQRLYIQWDRKKR